ncbi:MAG: 16S rRNA (cytosine(967)-C(5))-methyltransferase RsmB [Clostridia bacterium]|nr:16S rRNA (cytosine(967)-C(5))-methyltransferase RsmB [Clostridia bacterium]
MTAREAALHILHKTESKEAYLNLVFMETLQAAKLSPADAAFAKELVFGVYREKLLLDFVIRSHSSLRLKKIDPQILQLLRMGVYQIYRMDKVPDHAAVSESVSLAKKCGKGKVPGFVNAVLRSVLREKDKKQEIDLSSIRKDKTKYLSTTYSYPEPLAEFFLKNFGRRAEALLAAGNKAPDLCVRVNRLKTNRDELKKRLAEAGIDAKDAPFTDCGLYLFGADEGKRKVFSADFTVQDQSSQLAALSLAPEPGDVVMDLCSAPGGKTTHLAELMENRGRIYAFDLYEKRLSSVDDAQKRLGLSIIETRAHDASVLMDEFVEKADKVLLDVPCSGLGIIRRKPDIKYKEDITDFSSITEIQKSILDTAKHYVKSGGVLVYSTCTVNPAENRDMIGWFLENNPDFQLSPITTPHISDALSNRTKSGILDIFPDTDESDGFFVCRMQKG